MGTLSFDVSFTEPYERLAITHRPDIETAVCLFVVGIIVTELAARNRHHPPAQPKRLTSSLDLRSVRTRHIRWIRNRHSRAGANALVDLLHLRACRYEVGPSPRPMMRLEHDGQVLLGGRVWGVEHMGLPGPEIELLVQNRGDTLERFILTPTPGYEVPLQPRLVAVALADQVGAAVRPRLRSA